ncbi:MAG: 30S ribosome-binding factor RbfA [Proteobacteria bacterium]|nr:30S ribosome-binding factor RbfA [Pseudomonadota bacterium]NOG59186.1 30S ribosome-binding factor RbfA [Pseudomonadota bacterium]
MPKEFGRNQRVAQFIKEELSVLVQREFPLNQYGMITLTNVEVSPDLGSAIIYLTSLKSGSSDSDTQAKEKLVAELNEQKGQFRQELSRMLTSRGVPTLRFKYDESIERAQRLTDIINSVSQTDSQSDDESSS